MDKLKEMLKRELEIWCMKNWLKHIDKEVELCDRYNQKVNHYKAKAKRHMKVVQKLYDEYHKLNSKEMEGAEE